MEQTRIREKRNHSKKEIFIQELTHLVSEGYLTASGSQYRITASGKGELQSVQQHMEPLYQEVVKNNKAASPI